MHLNSSRQHNLLKAYYVPGTILNTGVISLNKLKIPILVNFERKKAINTHTYIHIHTEEIRQVLWIKRENKVRNMKLQG